MTFNVVFIGFLMRFCEVFRRFIVECFGGLYGVFRRCYVRTFDIFRSFYYWNSDKKKKYEQLHTKVQTLWKFKDFHSDLLLKSKLTILEIMKSPKMISRKIFSCRKSLGCFIVPKVWNFILPAFQINNHAKISTWLKL